jgi:fimbrial chaperone protein
MLRRLALIGLLAGPAVHARAAGLQVVPILVELSANEPRASIVLRNLADAPIRLELTVSAWDQSPDGKMVLGPAPNLVVFPPILELAPQAERKVRVSATGGFGATEGSYRLFVNELPSTQKPTEKNAIRFLTRMGIPIFLSPTRSSLRVELAGAAAKDGHLAFDLRNVGTTRLSPGKVKIEGLGADGATLFSSQLDTWYVLAGGTRSFDFAVPAAACKRVRKLAIELPAGKIPIRTGVETPGGACGP